MKYWGVFTMETYNTEETKEHILIIILKYTLHLASVFVRGTLFYLCKFLYFVFKLEEFETEEDDEEIYEVIDDLNHTFNFKRSRKFEDLWDDYTHNLENMIMACKTDAHNQNTRWTEKIQSSIREDVKMLIVLAEKEALNRSFKYYSKHSEKARTFDLTQYMFDETLSGYDTGSNEKHLN